MKYFNGIIMVITFLAVVHTSATAKNSIVGEWEGTTKKGEEITIVFKDNGEFVLISGNSVFKSRDLAALFNEKLGESERFRITYECQYKPSKCKIDIVYYDSYQNEEVIRTKSIFEFLTATKVRIDIKNMLEYGKEFKDWVRPDDFDEDALAGRLSPRLFMCGG